MQKSRFIVRRCCSGLILAAAGVLVVAVGCSHEASPLTRVEGRITYQGKAVSQGVVSFTAVAKPGVDGPPPAAAALESDGTYRLRAQRDIDGVLPGEYAVSVTSYRNPQQLPGQKVEYAVPAKYADPRTSGLTATVPPDAAGKSLRFDFDLGD